MKIEATKQSIEFTFEKSETLTVRRTREIVARWCRDCGREVRMSPPEDAARITGVTARKIYSGIESGNIHFAELGEGMLLVCLRSMDETRAEPQLSEGELNQP